MGNGLPPERHREIVESLSSYFPPDPPPLHKVKGRASESNSGSSLDSEPELQSEAIEVKDKVRVKVKVNNLMEQEPEQEELHKVMEAKYGNIPPQFVKDGITIFRPLRFFGYGKELGLKYDNPVFEVNVYKFAMGHRGRWPSSILLELQKGALKAIGQVTEEFIGEKPKCYALWRYGMVGAPKWCAAVIGSEIEAEELAKMMERDIIEALPRFRDWNTKREYRRIHRSKAEKGPSTPPHPGSEG